MAQYSSNIRNRAVGLSKMFAGLVLTASTLATISPVWGQYGGESRWSTANPPTPALVDQGNIPDDDQLRRLPPIDEVSPSYQPPTPSHPAAPQPAGAMREDKVAAKPQTAAADPALAKPVDWSNPSVVIGPEARTVSHEEVVAQPQVRPSRYSSESAASPQLPVSHGGSRFTQEEVVAPVTQQAESSSASDSSVFARVFDENEDNAPQPEVAQPVAEEPAPETLVVDSDLSPIFACRLLGLPATKGEDDAAATTTR